MRNKLMRNRIKILRGEKMNIWTSKSIELANQSNYLDLLYKIYPMSVNLRRELKPIVKSKIEKYYNNQDGEKLLRILLEQEVFPIKDSYVAYLKRDKTAISRNPATVERLTGMLYEMGLKEIFNKTTQPKETNRQIGPLFKNWINSGSLGAIITKDHQKMLNYNGNIILNTSDADMKLFAKKYLGYSRDKGLDFIGKFNNKYIVGEAKFLTDFGGHQNAQFFDAISTMRSTFDTEKKVIPIAILDGVLYIKNKSKMYRTITQEFDDDQVIISAVLLRDYLYSI